MRRLVLCVLWLTCMENWLGLSLRAEPLAVTSSERPVATASNTLSATLSRLREVESSSFEVRGFSIDGAYKNGFRNLTGFDSEDYVIENSLYLKGAALVPQSPLSPVGMSQRLSKAANAGEGWNAGLELTSHYGQVVKLDVTPVRNDTWQARLLAYRGQDADYQPGSNARYALLAPTLQWTPSPGQQWTLIHEARDYSQLYNFGWPVDVRSLRLPRQRFYGADLGRDHDSNQQTSLQWHAEWDDSTQTRLGVLQARNRGHYPDVYLADIAPAQQIIARNFGSSRSLNRQTSWQGELARRQSWGDWLHTVQLSVDMTRLDQSLAYQEYAMADVDFDLLTPVNNQVGVLLDQAALQTSTTMRLLQLQDQIALADRFKLLFAFQKQWFDQQHAEQPGSSVNFNQTSQGQGGRLGLWYADTDSNQWFVQWVRTVNPNEPGRNGQFFAPRQGQQIELGWQEANQSKRLSWGATLYHLQESNLLTQDPADPAFMATAGRRSSSGIEFDCRGQLTEQLSLNANLVIGRARLRQANGQQRQLAGVPRVKGSAFLQYKLDDSWSTILPEGQWQTGLGLFYDGSSEVSLITQQQLTLPSSLRTDVTLSYSRPGWSVQLAISNLTQRKLLVSNEYALLMGAPRLVELTVEKSF